VLRGHVLADLLGRLLVEQVDGDETGTILAELGGERAQALLATADEHDLAIGLTRKPSRGGFADPAGGAGDQGDAGTAMGGGRFFDDLSRVACLLTGDAANGRRLAFQIEQ
jgi:hypothetical protein